MLHPDMGITLIHGEILSLWLEHGAFLSPKAGLWLDFQLEKMKFALTRIANMEHIFFLDCLLIGKWCFPKLIQKYFFKRMIAGM